MQQLETTVSQIGCADVPQGEKEVYAFLDSLRQVQFYGELTLYFQNGNIEHCRTVSRIAKKDIVKAYQKPLDPSTKTARKKVIVKIQKKHTQSSHKQPLLFALPELPAAVIPRGGGST